MSQTEPPTSPPPSLEDLRAALQRAETAVVCADMIDSFSKRERELEAAKRHLDTVAARLAAAEAEAAK